MTITNTIVSEEYVADGVQVLFSIPFDYQLEEEVLVYVEDTLKTEGADYTLTDSDGNPTTPNDATHVKFTLAPDDTFVVKIERSTELTQEDDFLDSDPSTLELVERGLDKLTQIVQELSAEISALVGTSDLSAIEADIDQLQSDLSDAETGITNLQNAVNDLSSENDDQDILIAQNASDIDDLESDVSDLQTLAGNNNSAILGINAAIVTINNTLVTLSNRISLLEAYFGGTGEAVIDNNTTDDLVDLLFDKDDEDAVIVEFAIFRKTDAGSVYSSGHVVFIYSEASNSWKLEKLTEGPEYSGVVFAISALGQVSYTSSDLAGVNYTGKIKYNIKKFGV